MGEWYTPPGGRAAYLEGVNRVLVEQDGVTRSMAIELLARFLGAVDQGAALNGVTLLYGLDNGAGLPGAVLQTKIDGYIAAGVNPLSIGWRSIGTEEGAVVVLVPGSGAVGGVAATTGVTTLTGVGVSTGVGVGSFNGSAATTSAASLTGSGAGSAPSTPVASVTAGNTQNTIALASGGSGATSYDIWWGTTPGTRTNHLPGVTLPYVHTGRTNGTAYYYSIMAINASGYSESAEVSGTPHVITLIPVNPSFETASNIVATKSNGLYTVGFDALVPATIDASAKKLTFTAGTHDPTGYAPVGATVLISGFSNGGNNGKFVVSAVSSTTITFSSATTLVNESASSISVVPVDTWFPMDQYTNPEGRVADASLSGSYVGAVSAQHAPSTSDVGVLGYSWVPSQIDATNGSVTFDMKVVSLGSSATDAGYINIVASDAAGTVINGNPAGSNFMMLFQGSTGIFGDGMDTSIMVASPVAGTVYTAKTFNLKSAVTAHLTSGKTWGDVVQVKMYFSAYSDSSSGQLVKYYIDNFR